MDSLEFSETQSPAVIFNCFGIMKHTILIAALLWAGWLGVIRAEKPNIVFIMADDLGHGHLGCYGQDKIKTPHIDKLAAEGMKFRNAYAGSAVCAPCRSVLMTGLHTGHTPVRSNGSGMRIEPEDLTVVQAEFVGGTVVGAGGSAPITAVVVAFVFSHAWLGWYVCASVKCPGCGRRYRSRWQHFFLMSRRNQ